MGIYIQGLFLQYDKYRNEDGSVRFSVSVAVGKSAYSVFMSEVDESDLRALSMGDIVQIKARPYISSKGYLNWSDGELVNSI